MNGGAIADVIGNWFDADIDADIGTTKEIAAEYRGEQSRWNESPSIPRINPCADGNYEIMTPRSM
jgi:hypothetical protein